MILSIIKRINTESFEQSDWEYINNYEKFSEQVKRFEKVFREEGIDIEKEKATVNCIKKGFDYNTIPEITGLSDEQIEKLSQLIPKD